MKLVSIQSPYSYGDIERNVAYAQRALLDSVDRGEAPFASHLLYPGLLDDALPKERARGLAFDYAFMAKCDIVAFYTDLGFSGGMIAALEKAHELHILTTIRHIGKEAPFYSPPNTT